MPSLPWALLGLTLGLSSISAMAQVATDRASDNRDIRRAEQARLGAATSQDTGGWDLEVNLPLHWSSNAVQTFGEQSVESGTPQADWNVSPDILLRYARQFDWVKLSAKLDVGEDRDLHQIQINQDAVFATLKAQLTNGGTDIFVPYVAYTPEADFLPFFAHWQNTLQDFYGGFTSGVGFHKGQLGRFRDAVNPGDWSMLLDLSVGQRLASPKAFENTFFRASVDIIYVATPDFEVAWYKNYSNLSSERYTVWEVGPAVLLAWHF
jgi:hypothetical protein